MLRKARWGSHVSGTYVSARKTTFGWVTFLTDANMAVNSTPQWRILAFLTAWQFGSAVIIFIYALRVTRYLVIMFLCSCEVIRYCWRLRVQGHNWLKKTKPLPLLLRNSQKCLKGKQATFSAGSAFWDCVGCSQYYLELSLNWRGFTTGCCYSPLTSGWDILPQALLIQL